MSMQPVEVPYQARQPLLRLPGIGIYCLVLLFLLGGCSERSTDPVALELIAKDSTWNTLERIFSSESYWTNKVAVLTKSTSDARDHFQNLNAEYRSKLLMRREAVMLAVQKAKKLGEDPNTARQETTQALRHSLAMSRDAARDAGRNLRVQLALLRRAQEFLDQAK